MGTILYPPLNKFLLRIRFQTIEYPTIHELSEIYKELSKNYPDPTRIRLLSSRGPDSEFFLGPIRFASKEKDNEILLFKDEILFEYNDKYTSWDAIFPKLVENFFYLAKMLKITKINRISLDYIDIFDKFPQKNFDLKHYFETEVSFPPDFELDYNDFIIGIRLKLEESSQNSILRIRGLKSEDEGFFKIQLETHFTITEEFEIQEEDLIKENFDNGHTFLVKIFKNILTDYTKKMIGM